MESKTKPTLLPPLRTRRLHIVQTLLSTLLLFGLSLRAQTITTTVVDFGSGTNGNTGQYTSQAIVNGNPAIAYYDVTSRDLKYVRSLDAAGTTWGTPVSLDTNIDSGQYASLIVVNGNPAIAYFNGDSTNLKFVRATDADGTTWGAPVVVVGFPSMGGRYLSLQVVNGNPAISYNGSLVKYVRASDINGTSWGPPVTVDSTPDTGGQTSLQVVNGNPAMCYSYLTGNLRYVRASNASGSAWGTAVILDSNGFVGTSSSLIVVNGNPTVAYKHLSTSNGELRYIRALDTSGIGWGTPVTVDRNNVVGLFTSLAVVAGNPAISYYGQVLGDLKYVRASDASGTNWDTPVTLDSVGDVGQYTSLAVVNGNAAISYYDVTNGNLKWATYVTGTGLTALENWRQTFYGTASNTGNAADTADPYHTGVPNLAVFAVLGPNQDPAKVVVSFLPQPQRIGTNYVLMFSQPAGVSGVTYGAEWCADLAVGNWTPMADTGSGTMHTFSVPVGTGDLMFFRLRVSSP